MRARGPARAGRARRAGPVPGGAPVAVVPLHVSSAAAPGGRGRGRRGRVCGAAGGQGEGEGGPVPSAPVPVRLVGTGSAVPERVVTNRDLEALVETDDAWIRSRTGIGERRVLGAGETVTGLAARACERALAMAGVGAEAVDLILLATSTADDAFGGAGLLQRELGATNAVAFDVTAACRCVPPVRARDGSAARGRSGRSTGRRRSEVRRETDGRAGGVGSGFVVAAVTGAQYVGSGAYRTVLVVGADAMSRLTDWRDRNTCILFGDASGAVVLRAGAPDSGPSGLLGFSMHRCVSRGVVGARLPSPPGLGASARRPVPGRTAGEPDRVAPCSNGGGYDNLRAPVEVEGEGEAKPFAAGPAARAGAGYAPVAMAGQEVFKFATRAVPQVLREAADRSGVALEDVDWFVLHQVSPPTEGTIEDCRG